MCLLWADVQVLSCFVFSANSRCSEGSATVVRDSSNSSLQLVEMCSNEGVWSPVCDHDWTLEDATVVCTELGYNNSGDCCPDITIYTVLLHTDIIYTCMGCVYITPFLYAGRVYSLL